MAITEAVSFYLAIHILSFIFWTIGLVYVRIEDGFWNWGFDNLLVVFSSLTFWLLISLDLLIILAHMIFVLSGGT